MSTPSKEPPSGSQDPPAGSESTPARHRRPHIPNWRRIAMVAGAATVFAAGTTLAAAMALSPPGKETDQAGDLATIEATDHAVLSETDSATEGLHRSSVTPQPASDEGTTPSEDESSSPPPKADNPCDRPSSSSPEVRVTEVSLNSRVIGYGNESDTERLPMAIAARPSGGSWLAWTGTDERVHLMQLGCDDKPTGTSAATEAINLQDVEADANGVVLLVTRKGECGNGTLCGGSSSPCNTMHMIRFDNSGQKVWERQVTNLVDGRTGYDDGARFVWWYQHHGRLATDGQNYAAYFGVAITVRNGNCVDIHQGDRMQVVDANGSLVSGHRDSFEIGCSHSWGTRIVWDPGASRFVMVCATDNGCRIAQPNPYRTVASGRCDGTLFGGDLVLASTSGYWAAWSQGGQVRLDRFSDGASNATVDTSARSAHPHLVRYSGGYMLLTWESGSSMAGQVYDAGNGSTVGSQFTIDVRDHNFQAFKAYTDGSAAYPAAGSSDTSITIARVMPLN